MCAQNGTDPRVEDVVLVLGDWLVDEHWVFGIHRSSTASRTGDMHLRALHLRDSVVQAFCGAGRSAYFLQQLYCREGMSPSTGMVGLGFWHRLDDDTLCSLFDPFANPNNLFRLTPYATSARPEGVDLINMNNALNWDKGDADRDKREYTTRIIRVYRSDRGRIRYDRLDWEPPLRPVTWDDTALEKLTALVSKHLEGKRVQAVVLKDMRKGTVTKELVEWLVGLAPTKDARWYISSKEWKPEWLDKLSGVKLRLYMIPQVAANEAIRKKFLSCWLARSGRPSREALQIIKKLATDNHAETIFVLPGDFKAFVYQDDGTGVVQSTPRPVPLDIDMGGASIIFPAMLACMEHDAIKALSLQELTSAALETASEWVRFEARRVRDARAWKPNHASPENVAFKRLQDAYHGRATLTPDQFGDAAPFVWEDENDEWKQSLKDNGVITRPSGREFQLWRSMIEVENYVCCDVVRRKLLHDLMQGIDTFAHRAQHHASCMLVAGPGTGKSFLAQKLADAAGLDFLEFNITQLRTKSDIIGCFDRIKNEQEKGSRLLVFMDEINAYLDGKPVYSAFLTPLEDGRYVSDGSTVMIKPCLWVFAGTERPGTKTMDDESRHGTAEKAEKGSDFESRLTLGVVDLTTKSKSPHDAADFGDLERIYLAVSLLKLEFSEVDRISDAVLRVFRNLEPSIKARDVKFFVRRFKDVQYGRVTARNVPENWPMDRENVTEEAWRKEVKEKSISDEPNIRIVTGRR